MMFTSVTSSLTVVRSLLYK